jgi:uncharacterized protein with PIN domain
LIFKTSNEVLRPYQMKFVVDNMLHGLGKELRVAGCDTVILGNDDPHSDAIRVSQRSNFIQKKFYYHSMLAQTIELFYHVVLHIIS